MFVVRIFIQSDEVHFWSIDYLTYLTYSDFHENIYNHTIVAVRCRTAIKALFLYFNLCLSVMFDSLSCSFTSISFLTNLLKHVCMCTWLLFNFCRHVIPWHRPFCVDLQEATFSTMRSFLEHYCTGFDRESPLPPFPTKQ